MKAALFCNTGGRLSPFGMKRAVVKLFIIRKGEEAYENSSFGRGNQHGEGRVLKLGSHDIQGSEKRGHQVILLDVYLGYEEEDSDRLFEKDDMEYLARGLMGLNKYTCPHKCEYCYANSSK